MSSTALAGSRRDLIRRILWIQAITIGWMTIEAIFALIAAWRAHSPALFAFGGDSAIELLSALVVYWRFRSKRSSEQTEQLAARIAGGLLFALAVCVTLIAALALLGHREVRPSFLGIGVLIVAAVVMPLLARQKRRLSSATASAALRADAAESALCGYLSIIALAGLIANAIWGITWADPLAALCLLPLIMKEGWQLSKADRATAVDSSRLEITSMTTTDGTGLRDKVRIAYSAAAGAPSRRSRNRQPRAFDAHPCAVLCARRCRPLHAE
jgi:divalent metal cation (Fe/Co/Zn/Cd) transporter